MGKRNIAASGVWSGDDICTNRKLGGNIRCQRNSIRFMVNRHLIKPRGAHSDR